MLYRVGYQLIRNRSGHESRLLLVATTPMSDPGWGHGPVYWCRPSEVNYRMRRIVSAMGLRPASQPVMSEERFASYTITAPLIILECADSIQSIMLDWGIKTCNFSFGDFEQKLASVLPPPTPKMPSNREVPTLERLIERIAIDCRPRTIVAGVPLTSDWAEIVASAVGGYYAQLPRSEVIAAAITAFGQLPANRQAELMKSI